MIADKYLRLKQVCERTGLSRATIYNMERAGNFPTKIALGARAVAWQESEITQWMESRKSVQKTGREAKPGRPPTKSVKAKRSLTEIAKGKRILSPKGPSVPSSISPAPNSVISDDAWEGDTPSHIKAVVKERLRRANNALHPQGDIIKRTHKTIVLDPRKSERKDPALIATSKDIDVGNGREKKD